MMVSEVPLCLLISSLIVDSGPGFLKLLAVVLTSKGDGVIFQSLAFLPRSYKPGVWVTAGKSSQIRCI